jgi:hypothetical protein
MSLFDSASLVVTPNGVKEGKLYSIKPSDGSGDLSVTRATTATRVNSAGLVEVVPYNLLEYSETFDTSWTVSNVTITANNTTAPNGTNTADKITCASGSSISPNIFYSAGINCQNGQVYTYSYYAKKGSSNFAKIRFSGSAFSSSSNSPIFNLNTGVLVSGTGTIENVGNGWYRISASETANENNTAVVTIDIPSSTGVWPNGNFTGSEYIYVWGAQLVQGTSAKDYLRTETRLNIPRLDYTNGSCPSILVEPQRTNLVTYSEQFDNAAWYKDNVSNSVNSVISPSGIQDADSILENTSNSTHTTYNRASMTSGQPYTQSCYFKANGRNRVIMQIFDNSTQYANAIFDLSSGVVVGSFGTATIQNMSNGWYRCTITGTSPATGLGYCVIGLCENTYSTPSIMPTYLGDITKGVYAWGFQIEAGSYATSYIPTVAASVTRNADVISKTGISSLIGQTEGTMFLDFVFMPQRDNTEGQLAISSSSGSDRVIIWNNFSLNTLGLQIKANGINSINNISLGSFVNNTRYKIAIGYKSGDTCAYVNGIQVISNTSTFTFINSLTNFILGGYYLPYEGHQKNNVTVLFKTRLSNDTLAQLTTI